MFNARTHTSEQAGIFGEPALEGVHSDGSDHSMTVFLGSSNMSSDSAVTFMHDNSETTGIPSWETNPMLIRGRIHHQHFLDTLIFKDHSFKHSVTSVHQLDATKPTTRDMLVVFTRRPKLHDHISGYADTSMFHLLLVSILDLSTSAWLAPCPGPNRLAPALRESQSRDQPLVYQSITLPLTQKWELANAYL